MERTALVLAGGFSTRFGQDKAIVQLNGKPLLKHVIDAVKPVVDEVVVVTSDQDRANRYSKLLDQSIRFAVDIDEAKGPLIGAITGFEAALGRYSIILPADSPFVSRDVADLFFDLCLGKSAVIPRWPNQQIEPLHSVYHTNNALAAAKLAVEEGLLTVRAMIERLRGVRYVSTLVVQELDPELRTFFNVNTPLDLRMAEGLLKRKPPRRRT